MRRCSKSGCQSIAGYRSGGMLLCEKHAREEIRKPHHMLVKPLNDAIKSVYPPIKEYYCKYCLMKTPHREKQCLKCKRIS